MKHALLAAIALACLAVAHAATPPSQGSYAVNLGIGPYGAPVFVPGYVPLWIDTTQTGVNPFGLPVPTSDQSPMPVVVKGTVAPTGAATSANQATPTAPGTSSTTAEPVQGVTNGVPVGVAQQAVTYTAPAASSITTGGTAVTALAANAIKTGCDIKNPATATETLFFSLTGTATTTESGSTFGLPAGAAYHCPAGTTQALSVNAATSGHAFSAQGY